MKKTAALLLTGLSIVIIVISSFQWSNLCLLTDRQKHNKIHATSAGTDIGDYFKWEHKILADPITGKIPDNIRSNELAFAATLPDNNHLNNGDRIGSNDFWNERGPWNVGGRTRAFAADITSEAVLLAGTAAGGMWRSADSGNTWTLTTPLAIEQSVSCLVQDTRSNHTDVWYYGSGECIGASASTDGAYYCGNGVYRSVDDGQTWTSLKSTAANNVNFKSFWQTIWSMAIDPSAPDTQSTIYVSTIGALYRSTDSGNTWKTMLGGNLNDYSYYTNVVVSPSGVVYATMSSEGPQKGIWRSADGIHFTNITPPNFPSGYDRVVAGISPTDENQVYFLSNNDSTGMPDTNFEGDVEWDGLWKYKYLSGDGDSSGGAWRDLTANLPSTGGLFDKYNCQGSYDMVVQFLPKDTATVFIGGTDIFRSTTGFYDTMHTAHIGGYLPGCGLHPAKPYPGHHPDQHVFFFSKSNPYIMYNGCDGGLFKTLNDTANPVSWHTFDLGYVTLMCYTVASDHTRPGGQILLAGAQDNNSLFDNSTQLNNLWTKPIFGDGSFCYIADTGKLFYFSSEEGKMFKTQVDTLNGTITSFNRIDPIGGKDYQFVNPYGIDPNNNAIMYLAGGKYLWRNNNLLGIPLSGGWDSITTNWIKFPDSIPTTGATISALAISTNPPNILYYGTSAQRLYRIDNANNGTPVSVDITSYVSGPDEFPLGSSYIISIAADPDSANDVIVAFSNYNIHNLFYSNNSGTSWQWIGGNLDGTNNPSIRWVTMQHLPAGGTIYWVAASTGLYATDSLKGKNTVWVQQGLNTIGNVVCDMVDVRPADGLVAVATHGHGVYSANVTSISQISAVPVVRNENLQKQFSVYPDPSPGKATVSFYLENNSYVQLKLYTISGNLAEVFPGGMMQAGYNSIILNGNILPSGIYFCELVEGSSLLYKKVMFIK